MYVMTRRKNEKDKVKTLYITNPRFDIDEVRRIKALIRFKLKTATVANAEEKMEIHDIHTMMKFGRCVSISTINGALYTMTMRVSGKKMDSMYILQPIYKKGDIHLNILIAYSVHKDTVI